MIHKQILKQYKKYSRKQMYYLMKIKVHKQIFRNKNQIVLKHIKKFSSKKTYKLKQLLFNKIQYQIIMKIKINSKKIQIRNFN